LRPYGRSSLHKIDDQQFSSPILAVFLTVQINTWQNVCVRIARISVWIWVGNIALNFSRMDDLVAGFADGQRFFLALGPVWPEQTARAIF